MNDAIRSTLLTGLELLIDRFGADTDVDDARAWLATQPAQWTPVEDGSMIFGIGSTEMAVFVRGPKLMLEDRIDGANEVYLPDNLRLCRLTPPPQEE